ncbi:MAG: amidohydrolase [Acidobacteriota bacterium]
MMTAGLMVAVLLLIACQPATQEPTTAQPEAAGPTGAIEGPLLITGGTVVTMDAADTIIEDGAVAVADGRIVAIGPASELAAEYGASRRVDAGGGIIMPGLINTHTHVPMVLFRGLADDLKLMDWLENHIFPAEAKHVDEEFVRWGTRLGCLEMLRGGTTTFVDMYFFEGEIAEEVDACGMRAVLGETLIDFPAPDHKTWESAVAGMRTFVAAWKDHPRITPAVAPHAPYTVSAEHLKEAHALATELDVPLVIHLAEDRAEIERITSQTGMSSVNYLESLGILEDRMLAAHMVWPSAEEIALLAKHNVGVAHNPQSNMKIAVGVAPVPELRAAGVAVGLGTDGAASNNDLDLWEEIDSAAKLHKVSREDPTLVTARDALRMATIDGARAIDMEDEIGSLEVGKRADVIVVGTDGFHQQPHYNAYSLLTYSTKASDVDTVIVDGRVVMEQGKVLTVDAAAVVAQAAVYRDRIAERSSSP